LWSRWRRNQAYPGAFLRDRSNQRSDDPFQGEIDVGWRRLTVTTVSRKPGSPRTSGVSKELGEEGAMAVIGVADGAALGTRAVEVVESTPWLKTAEVRPISLLSLP